METIRFDGKEWPVKYVLIDDEYFMVGTEKFENVLIDNGNAVSNEAKAIDEMIYCYVPDKQFRKNETQLTTYVEKNFF